jgi:hypothetical protein
MTSKAIREFFQPIAWIRNIVICMGVLISWSFTVGQHWTGQVNAIERLTTDVVAVKAALVTHESSNTSGFDKFVMDNGTAHTSILNAVGTVQGQIASINTQIASINTNLDWLRRLYDKEVLARGNSSSLMKEN